MASFAKWAFATVCDREYFPGLWALLNSVWAYHRAIIPLYVFDFNLTSDQLAQLRGHPLAPRIHPVSSFPFHSPGTWEAKQQVFSFLLPHARCIYLLDADLVLVSKVEDVFKWAEQGKIVSSHDGPGKYYRENFKIYGDSLPGAQSPYLNSGALCLDTRRHWDLSALWAFASQYSVYSPHQGHPLQLPGHGDQGVFNAIACLLQKRDYFHILPETEWCDSTIGCSLEVESTQDDGQLSVLNRKTGGTQRVVHSSGPKWWTEEGRVHQAKMGDKLQIFEHFYYLFQ